MPKIWITSNPRNLTTREKLHEAELAKQVFVAAQIPRKKSSGLCSCRTHIINTEVVKPNHFYPYQIRSLNFMQEQQSHLTGWAKVNHTIIPFIVQLSDSIPV